MVKKYELTNDIINYNGFTLHRIKALRSFNHVEKGELGGYIEKEDNLSHENNCWIYGNAKVFGDAKIFRNAEVFEDARVGGNALVYGNARVYGNAEVGRNALVYEDAKVFGNAWVFGYAKVFGDAKVFGNACVYRDADITKECLNICNRKLYQYNITFTDYHIAIGCKQMSFIKWLEVSLDDAIAMGLREEYYNNVKSLLEFLIPQYYDKELA
jgi:carbonic anhydrase/acetyltransferase-like protein (isoleucine patch superfamily)